MSENNYDFSEYILNGEFAEEFKNWFNNIVYMDGSITVLDVKDYLRVFSNDLHEPKFIDVMFGWTERISCKNFEELKQKRSLIPMYKLKLPKPKELE